MNFPFAPHAFNSEQNQRLAPWRDHSFDGRCRRLSDTAHAWPGAEFLD
jgi:hypothetical protein